MWLRPFTAAVIAFALFEAATQNRPPPVMQSEIAHVEAEVDMRESAALAQTSRVFPGDPEAIVAVGRVLFFDKNLSVNRNTACAFCHIPEAGFQGDIEIINRTIVNQPGSVRTRFSLRKPPSAAYAAFSPPLLYPTKPGEPNAATASSAAISGTSVRQVCG